MLEHALILEFKGGLEVVLFSVGLRGHPTRSQNKPFYTSKQITKFVKRKNDMYLCWMSSMIGLGSHIRGTQMTQINMNLEAVTELSSHMGALSGWPRPMQIKELIIEGMVSTGFTHLYLSFYKQKHA